MSNGSLLSNFSALDDTRQFWKVTYPLPEILLIVLCGTMAGADDFVEIRRWAERKIDILQRLLLFANGVPSHDMLNDVMNALPADLFSSCFTASASSSATRRSVARATKSPPSRACSNGWS